MSFWLQTQVLASDILIVYPFLGVSGTVCFY